jgi:hypothetical protein
MSEHLLAGHSDQIRSNRAVYQVGLVLATLIRRDPLLLRFKVPERDAVRIKVGWAANFKVRDSDQDFVSWVIHVAASAEEESRMVEVVARINDTGEEAYGRVLLPKYRFRSVLPGRRRLFPRRPSGQAREDFWLI